MRQITLSYIIGILAGATLFFDVVPAFALLPIIVVMWLAACFLKSRVLQTVMLCLAFGFFGVLRMEQEIVQSAECIVHSSNSYNSFDSQNRLLEKVESLRSTLEYQMGELGLEGDELSVAMAMTLGDKNGIDQETRDVYSHSGASHVLALSGMHMAIIFAILTLLLTKFPYWMKYLPEWYLVKANGTGQKANGTGQKANDKSQRLALRLFIVADWFERKRWVMVLVSLLLLWSYIVLVGMPASALRAGVMLTAYSLATLLGRVVSLIDALVLAAFFILIFSPLSLYDVGFQMSFLAVLGIALYYNPINTPLKRLTGLFPLNEERKRFRAMGIHQSKTYKRFLRVAQPLASFFIGTFALTISAQILVLPLVAYYFHQIPCYGILTSFVVAVSALVIVWLGACLIGFMMIGLAFGGIGVFQCMARYLAVVLNYVISIQNSILACIASLPHSTWEIHLSFARVILVYVIIACLTMVGKRLVASLG